MGLLGTAMTGTTAATKAVTATGGTEETSNGAGRCHHRDFFSLSILRILTVFLLAGLQYDLAPTTTT